MKITPDLFEAFLKCATKCWLRATGEPAGGNPYAEWVKEQNETYRAAATDRLLAQISASESALSPPAENLKAAKWRLAAGIAVEVDFPRSRRREEAQTESAQCGGQNAESSQSLLASAATASDSALRTPNSALEMRLVTWAATPRPAAPPTSFAAEIRLHVLERVPSEGRGKAARFIPIRFIFRNKLTKDDKLLLAFDALLLSEMLGREVSLGNIIHGDDHATLKVKTAALASEVRKHLEKIAALLSGSGPLDLVLNRHCAECEFQTRCRQKALEKDDLSLLAGMSAKERKKLHSKGIFTVTQLSYTFRPRRRPKRLRDKRETYHHSLKALAIREQKIHIVGNPELKIEGTPVYLDVEGLPDRDFYYLIGLRIGNGDSAIQHSLWADTVEDEGKIWREFLAILDTVEKPVLIHYGSYETTFLKRMDARYGDQEGSTAPARAIASAVNIPSFVFGRIYFPTHSNKLKDVGACLGARWSLSSISGLQAVVWRLHWEKTHEVTMRNRLLTYNQDDCEALDIITAEVLSLIADSKTRTDVDFADAPKSRGSDRVVEIHRTFDAMLRSAYSDYSKSRVVLTGSIICDAGPTPVTSRVRHERPKLPAVTGRVIRARRKRKCDLHPERPTLLVPKEMAQRALLDVAFTANGCRKTVLRYVGRRARCPYCTNEYVPPAFKQAGHTAYGPGFITWVVYLRIALRLSHRLITQASRELLGIDVPHVGMGLFLRRCAESHINTEQQLQDRILQSPAMHVDETKLSILGQHQYVWVLTDGRHVIFRLTEGRETGFLEPLLANYQGTLVSDFYGGYDALPCRQQKCLVHLIRDLNDDLWKNPFDVELEVFIAAVRDLLLPIFADIQKCGLKAYYLRKHKHRVDAFYRSVIDDCASAQELIVKYQKRFLRHRESLFTFLDRDDVPWNNNAAERALRHLAVQRKISGAFSNKGAQDYIRMLGIAQSCRFQEKSFLGFLRCGLLDVDAYRETRNRRRQSRPTTPATPLPADAPVGE